MLDCRSMLAECCSRTSRMERCPWLAACMSAVQPWLVCRSMLAPRFSSIFTIASNSVVLDPATKTQIATGDPNWLREHSDNPAVREFLNRGEAN